MEQSVPSFAPPSLPLGQWGIQKPVAEVSVLVNGVISILCNFSLVAGANTEHSAHGAVLCHVSHRIQALVLISLDCLDDLG